MAVNAIPVDQRVIDIDSRRFASIEKALVELITNADDSYARLERAGVAVTGRVRVQYERHRHGALLTVADQAEGLPFDKACVEERAVFEHLDREASGVERGCALEQHRLRGGHDGFQRVVIGLCLLGAGRGGADGAGAAVDGDHGHMGLGHREAFFFLLPAPFRAEASVVVSC